MERSVAVVGIRASSVALSVFIDVSTFLSFNCTVFSSSVSTSLMQGSQILRVGTSHNGLRRYFGGVPDVCTIDLCPS